MRVHEIALIVRCAWCGLRIKRGRTVTSRRPQRGAAEAAPVSHGICGNCYAEELEAIRRIDRHRHP